MKPIIIFSIAIIGLLSFSLIDNASANEGAFRAAAEKAWKEIQAHDALPITPIPNGTNYSINATSGNETNNLGSPQIIMSK
ncbi:hypothetical protein [Candidatus Nitrosotalea okcheonensis]|uniref:Uncharacterized protein n=1 Tax=Candidatus Nitrosotalea okcheonensis TaxID=1903276 RepID=A0A2H1FF75_9ARCH|nr:hypothetical protein [Candidatus Nitrosotalea okcheonensis]SMH71427.1 exported protein of unknown function [Candidatus Nitrosotalea okcheonensis]